MAEVLRLTNVRKYFGARAAVDDVSLVIEDREAIALFGPSGCGKTTTLRLIAGLETPAAGEIRLNGDVVSAAGRLVVPPHQRNIGFVFQDLALWPHMTVSGNLRFVLESVKLPRADVERRIRETLALARIDDRAQSYPYELSGGEQQRVALARALVHRPRLVLLDEPLSSLDADLNEALSRELTELRRHLGFTMIYVTHDAGEARAVSDRIIHMRSGRVVPTHEGRG